MNSLVMVPLHVVEYWREEWSLPEDEIDRLQAEFARDFHNRHRREKVPPREPLVRLSPDPPARVLEMVELNQTMNLSQIAEHYGVTNQYISYLFKRYKIEFVRHPARRRPKARPGLSIDLEAAYQHYQQTKNVAKTAKAFGVSMSSMLAAFKAAGKDTTLGRKSKLPEIDELIALLQTHSAQEIAARYGVRRVTVYSRVRAAGRSVKDFRRVITK